MTACDFGECDDPPQPFVYRWDTLELCNRHASEYAEVMDGTVLAAFDEVSLAFRRLGRELLRPIRRALGGTHEP